MSKKNKQLKPESLAIADCTTGERKVSRSAIKKEIITKEKTYTEKLYVFLALAAKKAKEGKEELEEEEEEEELIKLTLKEKAKIKAETKAAKKALAPAPIDSFANISPAPALAKMSLIKMANYVGDRLTRIDAVTEFDNCSPSVSFCSDILDNLVSIVSIDAKDRTSSQKIDLKVYAKQMRQNFMLIANSCAALSIGNIKLFGLTSIATRGKGYIHKKQLDACEFKLSAKAGKGKIRVVIKKMDYARNYTVFYGVGAYDKATWNSKTGSAIQTISEFLVPGQLTNFFVVANGYAGPGVESDPQGINVPFN